MGAGELQQVFEAVIKANADKARAIEARLMSGSKGVVAADVFQMIDAVRTAGTVPPSHVNSHCCCRLHQVPEALASSSCKPLGSSCTYAQLLRLPYSYCSGPAATPSSILALYQGVYGGHDSFPAF